MSLKFKVLLYTFLLLGAVSFSILLGEVFVQIIPSLSIAYLMAGSVGVLIGMSVSNICIFIFHLDEPYDFEYPDEYYEPLNMVGKKEMELYEDKLSASWKMMYRESGANTKNN